MAEKEEVVFSVLDCMDDEEVTETETTKATKKSKTTEKRTRNWAFIVYEDSAPPDWVERLKEFHTEMLISPLHNADVNPTGEKKKPHFHVIVMFAGVKSRKQAQEVSNVCSGVNVERVVNIRGYARYLTHKDNPEKAQYSEEEVVALGGADYLSLVGSAADDDEAIREIIAFARKNKIFSFARLVDYAAEERSDWFRLLTSKKTIFMSSYLKAAFWEEKEDAEQQLNETRKLIEMNQKRLDFLGKQIEEEEAFLRRPRPFNLYGK